MTAMADMRLVERGGAGPDLLLVHGFAGDRLSWLANEVDLAGAGRVWACDLPAHGDTPPDIGDGSAAALAERVAGMIDRAGLSGLTVIGHSLGGAVAITLAHARPELVSALALVAPAGLGKGIDKDFLATLPRLAGLDEAEILLRRLVVSPRLIRPVMAQRLLDHLERPGVRAALERIAARLTGVEDELAPAAAAVAAAGLRRLVIWGEEDGINPPDAARGEAFGGERLTVPGVGHLPQVEAARAVNAALVAFVAPPGPER